MCISSSNKTEAEQYHTVFKTAKQNKIENTGENRTYALSFQLFYINIMDLHHNSIFYSTLFLSLAFKC